MPARNLRFLLSLLGGALAFVGSAEADTAVLTAVADTTLIETEPDNNLGGAMIVNAGTTQNFTRNRGLFRYDLVGQIPPGARVTRVDFVVEVTGEPKDGFTASSFGLHRMLKSWGEGNKASPDPLHPGLGAPATSGEATWNARFAFTTNTWTIPGGAATNDYVADFSAVTFVFGIGDSPYTFISTPKLISDVQTWVDDPATNFGWVLICEAEEANFTARRFASHEDVDRAPYIIVDYAPPRIDGAAYANGQFSLSFVAQADQPYTVQFSDSLASSNQWSVLTNLAALSYSTNVMVVDPATNRQRFYRLSLP